MKVARQLGLPPGLHAIESMHEAVGGLPSPRPDGPDGHGGLYYVPTRYPNGLPGGIPSEAFGPEDSSRAIGLARTIIDAVSPKIPKNRE